MMMMMILVMKMRMMRLMSHFKKINNKDAALLLCTVN